MSSTQLSSKSVTTEKIDDKSVTKEKLEQSIQNSLDKIDSFIEITDEDIESLFKPKHDIPEPEAS